MQLVVRGNVCLGGLCFFMLPTDLLLIGDQTKKKKTLPKAFTRVMD